MKTLVTIFTLVSVLCTAPAIVNAESGHDHSKAGGPKGGRLLDDTEPRAEFFVEKDNTATITFYDDALKPVAATEQTVTVIADAEGNKSTVEFEKKGDVLVSKSALPEGDGLNLVVQFRQTAEAKPMNFRFTLDKGMCGMCKRAEYACICEH
jgi:hypothetical protein